uniref:Uncharacterized protein n=1 Tax=Daphnia magna TaxID=35525 RepID=A0A0P5D6F1_9CRUS
MIYTQHKTCFPAALQIKKPSRPRRERHISFVLNRHVCKTSARRARKETEQETRREQKTYTTTSAFYLSLTYSYT